MTFLAGGFLAGLGLITLPVLIHLIVRRKRKLIPWGAMQFLMGTPPRFRQRLQKLSELLVLLVRILAVTVLVLAFAQPLMQSGVLTQRSGENVLLIDASLSASRITNGQRRAFDEEIAAAEAALKALGESETVRILLASDSPRWLTSAPLEVTFANREALRSMLRALQPTRGSSDLTMALGEVLQSPPAADRNFRRITIFTDATERPWHAAEIPRWRAIKQAVAAAAVPTAMEASVVASAPNPTTLTNLSLNRLTVDHETIGTGDSVSLTAEVHNASVQPSSATEMIWQLDTREVERSEVPPMDPGSSTTIEVSLECGAVGSHVVRAALSAADDLPADNEAAVAIRTLDEIPLLVVDGGRERGDEGMPESGFFLAALGHLPGASKVAEARAAFRPKVIAPEEMANVRLDTFYCVVLADVESVDNAQATRLAAQVAAGGGLWMALGDRVNIEAFNNVFASAGVGLSPVRLGPIAGEVTNTAPGWRVLPPSEPHPATMLLRDPAQLDIDRARVQRHHTILPPVPPNLSRLLTLETQAPLVIEHAFGKGRVFIQFAPLDRTWNNLPILHTYVPMVREFLWRLADGRVSRRNLSAGETLRVALQNPKEAPFTVFLPDGQKLFGASKDGEIRFSGTFLPGVYRVESGAQEAEIFSVPRPAEESDLSPLTDATRRFLGEQGVFFGGSKGNQNAQSSDVRERRSITPTLLWIVLCLFLLEALLTLFFANQRTVRHRALVLKPVTMR